MLKKILHGIADSICKYSIDTVFNALRFKSSRFNSIFFWLITVLVMFLTLIKNKGLTLSILVGVATLIILFAAGYILFLVLDYIPKLFLINTILPIREKLDEILRDSQITKHSFTEPHEIEKIEKIIKLERMPTEKVLEIWLYKLKTQRNMYIIISPLAYLMLSSISTACQSIHITWIDNLYKSIDNLIKSSSSVLQVIKWAFIVLVLTNETININEDISRIELLKGLSSKK